jgi:alpha-L-arabinofuranosidase
MGRDKPWKVKYIGLGNEVWGCGGEMRAEYGIDVPRRYAYFLNAPDGQTLTKVAGGPTANLQGYEEFTDTVKKNAKELFGAVGFQALSLHYYAGPAGDDEDLSRLSVVGAKNTPPGTRAVGFSEDKWGQLPAKRESDRAGN